MGDLVVAKLGVPLEGYLPLSLPIILLVQTRPPRGGLLAGLYAHHRQAPLGPLGHLTVV